MHDHNHIDQAIDECRTGRHVAHVTNTYPGSRGNGRVVAIRPWIDPKWRKAHQVKGIEFGAPGHFTLTFSDPRYDLRDGGQDTIERVTARQAKRLIGTFLRGYFCHQDDGFDLWINQAERWCYILGETATPTRVRIEYEMPNAGTMGSWCHATRLGNYYYLET
jgi:hypothetical protein